MIKTEVFANETDILIAPELAFALPCIVGDTGVVANAEGKKIIKAGTPLYGSANPFMERQTVLAISGTKAYGVARWDIDVTAGSKNATLLVDGYVDYLKLDDTVKALVDAQGVQAQLDILFIKGRAL